MQIISKNPSNNVVLMSFEELTQAEIDQKIISSQKAFELWKDSTLKHRGELLDNLSTVLTNRKEELAKIIALEVGQPVKAALGEIEKCALTAIYYKNNIEEFLKPRNISTEYSESYVCFEPMGVILGVSPWNFPFWMAFRFIIPTITSGNSVLLKHSSNVPQCSLAIQEVMTEAGFPTDLFQSLLITSSKVESVINNDYIKGVSFAGSEKAGGIVASQAGMQIKKTLLELGGSDPFIILEDADLENCTKILVENRLRNAGQACNSPKRVFIHENIFDKALDLITSKVNTIKIGDPLDISTEIGPLSTQQGLVDVDKQVVDSLALGAVLVTGGNRLEGQGNYYSPTVIINAKPGMPVFDQEVFGPVIVITKIKSIEESVDLSNQSRFGLGASVWTSDIESIKPFINKFETANVYINQPVRSDPRLPYGGTKKSGYGRELSDYGIKEFTNIKTVVIK